MPLAALLPPHVYLDILQAIWWKDRYGLGFFMFTSYPLVCALIPRNKTVLQLFYIRYALVNLLPGTTMR